MRNNYFDQILSSFPIQEAYYVISFPSSLCLELYLEFFFNRHNAAFYQELNFCRATSADSPRSSFRSNAHRTRDSRSAVPSSRLFLRARTLSRTASQLHCLLHHARMLLLPTCPPACLIRFRQCPSSSAHVSGHRKHFSASIVDL